MSEPTTLQAARERAIDLLCRRFADDTLSMSELERQLDKARSARTRDELRALLNDLPPPAPVTPRPDTMAAERAGRGSRQRPAPRPEPRTARPEGDVRSSGSVALAVLGGTRRAGKWAPPENMLAFAVMGGVELDFREAVLEPGSLTTINCFAFWGGIEIIVPPHVRVDTRGFALLGGFAQSGDAGGEPPPDAPRIEVNGFALMAGVDVTVRERGGKPGPSRSRGELGPGPIGDR